MKSMKSMNPLKSMRSPMTSMSFKKFSGKRMYVVAFLALVLLGSLWYLSGRNVREGIDETTTEMPTVVTAPPASTMSPAAEKTAAILLPKDPKKEPAVPSVNSVLQDMMSKLTPPAA